MARQIGRSVGSTTQLAGETAAWVRPGAARTAELAECARCGRWWRSFTPEVGPGAAASGVYCGVSSTPAIF